MPSIGRVVSKAPKYPETKETGVVAWDLISSSITLTRDILDHVAQLSVPRLTLQS